MGSLPGLLAVLVDAFDNPDRYLERQPSDPYLHDLQSSELFLAIVAEAWPLVVAELTGYVVPKFEQAHRHDGPAIAPSGAGPCN